MITEIIPNLSIGTIWDAIHCKENYKLIIEVAEHGNFSDQEWNDLTCQNRVFLHAPFLVYPKNWDPDGITNEYANLDRLDLIAYYI
jgi:hypothetical protein